VIVIDASAMIEFLLDQPLGASILQRLETQPVEAIAAPHLLNAEVGQTLRRYERRGELDEQEARAALITLADLPLTYYPHAPLLARTFDLRANVTVYDGLYLALAETLNVLFVTADTRLAHIPGCRAVVEVLQPETDY